MRETVAGAFSEGKRKLDLDALKAALRDKNQHAVFELVSPAIEATAAHLKGSLVGVLAKVRDASADGAAKALSKILEAAWFDDRLGYDSHGREDGSGKDRAKVIAAKESYKPATAEKQRWAEGNESTVASMTGGKGTDDNKPADVVVKIDGKTHGVEVKTLLEGRRDKVTMHPKSRERKEAWAKKNSAVLHTIALDDRKAFGSKGYSGHRIYYRRGVGSFRLKGMTKVTSTKHLQKLMREKQ